MNNDNIFTVKPYHLSLLDEDTSIEFFQRLLWAEARRLGLELCKINISHRSNVRDGGIDATVDNSQISNECGIIKQGEMSFQIKSGKFSPGTEKTIKDELFKPRKPTDNAKLEKKHLKDGIRDCLETNRTYVLVCTGVDLVNSQYRNALNHIKYFFKCCGYSNSKIDVWSQNNLISFLEFFPSLALWVTGRNRAKFQTHKSWQRNADMQVSYVKHQSQKELIRKIREDLRQDNELVHVQIAGQPGIGKTRLVLNATKVNDLAPLVIYCSADSFLQDTFLMNELSNDDNQFFAIVVIDDCNMRSQSEILAKLRYRNPRIKLVTIYNNHEDKTGDFSPYIPVPLENDQIRSIIQKYTNDSIASDNRWTELCSGSPRVAHVIGWNLANHPQNVLNTLTTVNIWEDYIVSVDDLSSERVEQRRRVLRYLALFKQFGFETLVGDEVQAVAKKLEKADPQITWMVFQEIIENLRKRKILQGESTLTISPKALHIKLWTEWWNIYGRTFNLEEFTQDLKPKLVEWFYEMFKFAAESGVASRVVKDLLGWDGPFQKDNYLQTEKGSRFFLALTEADPNSALRCLMRTIGTWDKETLLKFTDGRRAVIWALEKIAIWRNLFPDAARLLLALGEAENERISNNASGVFAKLFSLGPGAVAPTEAAPIERLPVLKEAFESGSKERRKIALNACNKGLQSGHFSRISGAENQGLRGIPKLWEPKTYGEWWDAYRRIWQLLFEQLEHLPEDEREEVVEIMLGRAGSIARIHKLSDMVVDTVRKITENRYASKKQIIETISQILFHDDSYVDNKGLSPEIRQHFEKIRDELVGSDFHSLMQRYVGMDILEDHPLEDGVDKIKPHLETLVKQSIDDPALLKSELSWLVTTEAQNGNKFGFELGQRDESLSLLPMLLDAQRNAADNVSAYFLGGYFHAIFDRDLTLWEQQLDSLCEDTTLNAIVPYLTHCSGLTDQAGLRIFKLAKDGVININNFGLFIYRNAITNLSVRVFEAWIELLLSARDRSSVKIALKLFYNYYISRKPEPTLPCELTFSLLSHPELFKESDNYGYDTMTDFYWTKTANALLNYYPQKALELVQLMLVSFGSDKTMFDSFSQSCTFLTEATERHPAEVWNYVSKYLGNYDNFSRNISIGNWLREADLSETEKEKGALTLIPREKIWEWVDQDVENRAWYLANEFVPKTLLLEEWHDSLARDLLVRYGDQEDVRSTLISNYSTEGFWGDASLHYEEKLKKLVNIQNSDNDDNVNRWINEFISFLEEQIEHAKIDEERRF